MTEPITCPQCGYVFPPADDEPALAGLCPRCLAGGLGKTDVEAELPPVTNNTPVRIDTIRAPLQPGAVFKGFEVLEILGQGGMGVVYKGRQQSLDRIVALKLLSAQLASSEEFTKRFDREAKVLASLNHPNVVHVHDFGKEAGLLYLVMEHVDGPTLESVMKKKPSDPLRFLTAVRDIALGLQRVHEAGLVHRDIKPSNILMTKDGTAKISDFGLAIETEETQKLTQSGMFVGTPHYVSPEHAQGKKIDGRSDLYSLGVILFEGFAGRPPFQAASATALLLKHVNEAPPALYKLAPQSPKLVQEMVRKLLAKNPAARYDTAAALVRDLNRALEELKAGPKPIPAARKLEAPAAPPAPKFPMKWIAAAGAAALVLILLGVALLGGKPEPKKETKTPERPIAVERPVRLPEEDKPKEAEPLPVAVPIILPQTPEGPKAPEARTPSAVEEAFRQGEKIFDLAKASFEEGKAKSSVELLSEAAFKAEEAKAKFSAVQEIGGDELKAKGVEQVKLVQQFLKMVHESRLAIQNAKGVPAPAPAVSAPAAPNNAAAPAGPVVAVPAAPAPAVRREAPEASALKDAEKTIRELYKADYARKSPSDQQGLAIRLLAQGRSTADDPRSQFVLFREARELALAAGDLDTMLAAIGEMGSAFEVDLVAMKHAALTKVQVRTPEATGALTEALIDLSRDAADADNYDVATSAAARADGLPKSANDPGLAFRLADLRREIAAAKEEYLKVKSSIDKPGTGDPEAVGKYYAFVKGDWERGLPILAASAKPPLNALSEKDLARPEETATQIETGDGWWDLAEKEKSPLRKSRLQDRAKFWYESAYPAAQGLGKTKIEKRLDALDAAVKGPVDLLKLIDPRADAINGSWTLEKGSLVSMKEWYGRIQVRYVPPEEYDLRLVVERRDHDEDLIVGLPKGDTQLTANLDAGHGTYSAFGIQATRADQSPQYQGKLFTQNRASILICSVRKKSVGVTVDGKKVLTYAWKGDEARSLIASQWEIPNRKVPFVGAHGTAFAIHSMLLMPVTGAGHVDRSGAVPAPAAARPSSSPTPAPKGAVDLLALVDPKLDAVKGDFSREMGGLVTPPGTDYARIHLPFVPPAEYELTVEGFRRTEGDCFGIGLVHGDRQGMVMLAGVDGATSGLEMIDGFNYMLNNTKVTGPRLEKEHAFKVVCTVRRTGIDVSLNGKLIIHWLGDGKRLQVWEKWAVPQKNLLFLGSQASSFHVTQATLLPLSGQGTYTRKPAAPAGVALPKGSVTDLLAIVDPGLDSVEGSWSQEGQALLSAPGQHVRLQFPVLPPEEYDLKVVMTRTEGNDGIAFGLAQPSAQWTVFVDKFPQEGSQSGLEMVDNGMLTLVRGGQVQNNVPITFEFKVRRGSFSVLKDGKAFLQWQGNSSRLSNFPRWVVKNPRALFLGQWENRLRYTEIKLTAVSGEGRLLRGGAAVPAPAVPKGSVDLLALIDPAKDAVKGEWTKDSSGLDCPAGNHIRLQIPYAPPDEYDLTIVANRKEGSDGLLVGLAKGDVQWAVTMDTQSSGTFKSGFESLDNRGPNDNATTYAAPVFTNGAEITLEFQVRKAGVTVIAGGKRIIEWKGSFNRLSLPDGWKVKNPNALFLAAWGSHYQFSRISLTPVSGTGSPLRKAAPQANGVDLLKMIEPRRDGQRGTWRFSEGALIADGHSASVHMRLDIPYVPPAEYDLIAVVEKEDQEISGDFFVVLPGGGRSCSFSMDGFGGTVSGIFDLDGKNPREGPSRVEGPFFKPGIARTITYSVRKDSLTVRADGQDFYSWKGNWNRVSVNAAMGGGGKIGVGTLSCVYHIKKLVLVPVVR